MQSPLWTLVRYRLKSIRNMLRGAQRESRLKIAVVSFAGLLFWAGLFFVSMEFIRFIIDNTGQFSQPLIHHIMSIFFLVVTVMLVFSNALISFSNLFKSNETAHLFSTPVPRETIFLYKLFESLVYSSWAAIVLGLPLLLALGIQTHADWAFYPAAALMTVPFVFIPAGIGALVGLLLTAYVPRHKGKILAVAGTLLLAVGVYKGMQAAGVRGAHHGSSMDIMMQSALGELQFARSRMSPNYWMSEGLLRVSEGHPDGWRVCGIFFLLATLSTAVFAVALGWFLAGSIYAEAFSGSHAMGTRTRSARRSWIEVLAAPFSALNRASGALIVKDLKTFFRDPAQWAQVLIFFGILVAYNTNIRGMATPIDQPLFKNMASFLNLGAASMTLATICSRFVFPMISLEGQRFWILGLAPIGRKEIIWSKFYFAFGGTALLSVPLSILSNWSRQSPPLLFALQNVTSLAVAFGLSGLSVGMGALFPNFKERNPSKIVSGFGGTLTLILSSGLVALSVGSGWLLFHRFVVMPVIDPHVWKPASDWTWAAPLFAFVVLLNFAAGILPMKMGARALERVEF